MRHGVDPPIPNLQPFLNVYKLSLRGRRLVFKCDLRVAAPSFLLPPRINAIFVLRPPFLSYKPLNVFFFFEGFYNNKNDS